VLTRSLPTEPATTTRPPGLDALQNNIIGNNNTATGFLALNLNNGNNNTATGVNALFNNRTGNNNTATGGGALFRNVSGTNNTAIGLNALFNNRAGSNNIALGNFAGGNFTTESNNIMIGSSGFAGESGTIRIGTGPTQTRTFIAAIRPATVASGVGVIVGSTGQLGTIQSSKRFKEAIKPMDKVSEAILALEPVTFRYKHELDPDGIPQFGLIAEQVEKVNPDLVARDADGKVSTVRYEAVNAMLLNEFLKEHRTVQELKSIVAKQDATILQQTKDFQAIASQQQKQIEALTMGLQKVSAQLEVSKPGPQTVLNNH
jgi:Chaperone of endosialidase